MDIETAKQLLKRYMPGHMKFVKKAREAERYYRNETDILRRGAARKKETDDPLRVADNRIPSNFHGLLVNQEAAYLLSDPPLFDIGGNGTGKQDEQLKTILGDRFAKFCKDMCVNASNCSVAWAHVWKDKTGTAQYAAIDPKQVIPIWTDDLNRQLKSVIRAYTELTDEGKTYGVVEVWTETECAVYRRYGNTYQTLEELPRFNISGIDEQTNIHRHNYGFVPFVPFYNNNIRTNDLGSIKSVIDSYDKVFSGFLNDLEDIQEVIFILSGYTGTDLDEFLDGIKKYKTVKLDDAEGSQGLSTLTIDIPVEAREKMLVMARKAIFEQGQGVDPDPQNFGNSSGAALRYLYSLLELKAGLKETEFKLGFAELIHQLCQLSGIQVGKIRQTWTRNRVSNDQELADIAAKSAGVISDETILERHPWVEDIEEEKRRLKAQREAESDPYNGALQKVKHGGGELNADEEE